MAFGHVNFKPDNIVRWFKRITGDITFSFASGISSRVAKIQGKTVSGTTGTVNVVFSTSPTLTTPTLGAATATTINKVTITQPATGSTLTVNDGVTITAPTTTNVLVISGTAKLSVGTSTPGSPATGDLWIDTN